MAQTQIVRGVKTKVITNHKGASVTYRGTEVFRMVGKTITLNTGGWRSQTTKLRINQAFNQFGIDASLFQKDFEWFVRIGNSKPVSFNGNLFVFATK